MTVLDAWEFAARQFEVHPRRWATPGAMAADLDPSTRTSPALELIDKLLVEVADGDTDRAMIFLPPQEGKSQRISRRFPLWLLAHDPTLRIAIVSYNDRKALRWGKAIRRDLRARPDLGIQLRADTRAAGHWETEQGGGVICVGIEGGITGEPADCMGGDTEILTEFGNARIEDIHRAGAPFPRILSYSHDRRREEWRPVVATRAIDDRPLVELRTTSGRVIRCTSEHRIYVIGRGYVPAADVEPGQRLLAAGQGADVLQQSVPEGGGLDTVYDLQVDGNRNFFADQVLVHNCLIIDDPFRGRAEAESKTYRDAAWDWWESNGSTRGSARFRVVCMMTRWHESDLAGRLLKHEPGRWKVLSIPAIAGKDITVKGADGTDHTTWVADGTDPLGRRPGEELQSVQGRAAGHFHGLHEIRSPYVWRSVFQQNPVAAEGNLFRRSTFRYWSPMPADPTRHGLTGGRRVDCDGRAVYLDDCWRFATADLAASTKTSADWTVFAAWAISPDGDLILLDRARKRVVEEDHWEEARPLMQRWALDTVFVEQSFISATFVIDATASGIPVQPVTADTDKLTRALPATTRLKAGRVWFPAAADWLDVWCDELAGFPSGSHDDQVDTLSYAARVVAAHWLRQESGAVVDARRAASRADDGAIGEAYESATGSHPNGTDYFNLSY